MKNILLALFSSITVIASQAQTATFITSNGAHDTVYAAYTSGNLLEIHNNITPINNTSITLKWKVVATNFAAGWDATASGVCDNKLCHYDVSAPSSSYEKSDSYTGTGDFHVAFAASNPAIGTRAMVTVRAIDTASGYSRDITFVAYRTAPAGVIQPSITENSIAIYPNPARDFVNVIFDKNAAVKTIAIFNLIGKTMRVFKPTDDNSARLDLDNITAGVYFVRLMNGEGQVVGTRRFTRQ